MDVKDGSPQLEPSSTVGQTLTVKDSGEKVYASGEDSDDELPEILSADSDSEDEDSTDDEAEDLDEEELDFNPAIAGRDHGLQKVPRFDLDKLRPFEVMFVDNKDYDDPVRGDYKTSLVFIDLKSQAKFKVDQRSKKENGKSFREIAVINGVHKLPYKFTVYSDGCESMKHVKDSAIKMGIDYVKIPPRDQSLNEAEKVCNFMWAAARTHLIKTGAPLSLMPYAVEYAMYVDLRMATTASRNHLTPYEMIRVEKPFIDHIRPFFTTRSCPCE